MNASISSTRNPPSRRRESQIQSRHTLCIFNPPDFSETTDFSIMKQTAFFPQLASSSWCLVALGHSVCIRSCIHMHTAHTVPEVYTAERRQRKKKKDKKGKGKRDTAVLIDRARFATRPRLNRLSRGNPRSISELSPIPGAVLA